MRRIKVASLVLDYNLYPRNNVDRHNVLSIKDAIASGATLPPIKVDQKSKRVVDGFHRAIAFKELDSEAEHDVIEQRYKTEADMFLDAMRLNSHHGVKLDSCDRVHCVLIAERLEIPIDQVAGALHVPVDRLGTLRTNRTAKTTGGLSIPIKRTFQHMAGSKLTKVQQEVNERSSGLNQTFYVNQLIDMLEHEMLDKSNANLLDRLARLQDLIAQVLAASELQTC